MSKQRSNADRISRRSFLATGAATGIAALAGCSSITGGGQSDQAQAGVTGETLTLTTTTSTFDTGLLDAIHPDFEEMYGVTVDAVAQGTGAALEWPATGTATW